MATARFARKEQHVFMNDDGASEYTLWVKLANDPSQTEEARQQYRAQMEAHVHRKLREAFQFAVQSTAPKTP
jgi:hypothetical protein